MTTEAIQHLTDLKGKLETLSGEKIKAETKLEAAMKELKDLGYETVEEAEDALREMYKEIHELEKKAKELTDILMDKYHEFI